MNNNYEYFETVQGYIPVAFIIGSPESNAYCKGIAKCDWVDNPEAQNLYTAWFTGIMGAGEPFKIVWVKE